MHPWFDVDFKFIVLRFGLNVVNILPRLEGKVSHKEESQAIKPYQWQSKLQQIVIDSIERQNKISNENSLCRCEGRLHTRVWGLLKRVRLLLTCRVTRNDLNVSARHTTSTPWEWYTLGQAIYLFFIDLRITFTSSYFFQKKSCNMDNKTAFFCNQESCFFFLVLLTWTGRHQVFVYTDVLWNSATPLIV